MKKLNLIVLVMFFFILISQSVFAQYNFFQYNGVQGLVGFILGNPNVPSDWLQLPNFIYFIVFPFIAIVAIIYGILSEIRIFHSQNVRTILAIVMAAISLPSGALIAFVYYLFAFSAWVAVGTFGVLFIVGTLLWGWSRGKHLKREFSDLEHDLEDLNRQLADWDQKRADGKCTELDYVRETDKIKFKIKQKKASLGTLRDLGSAE